MPGVEIVTESRDALGECPVWLARERMLQRVDITASAIVRLDVGNGREERHATGGHVGFALPAPGGGLVAGVERRLVRLAAPGAPEELVAEVEPGVDDNRFNDAAFDPAGRLWAGTMSRRRAAGAAALYRVSADGDVERAIAGATISNGLDWSPDFSVLYYVDSTTQRIDAIAFDLDRGRLGTRRRFAAIDPRDGLPDGLTVDEEGGVWLALFGGAAVRRYLPDGRLDAEIRLPVTNPTSPAFGGAARADLYVTSARHRLTAEQLAREPAAGAVLRLRPGVHGRAAPWSGTADGLSGQPGARGR
jgi:sugar lactone lactonase YvrE